MDENQNVEPSKWAGRATGCLTVLFVVSLLAKGLEYVWQSSYTLVEKAVAAYDSLIAQAGFPRALLISSSQVERVGRLLVGASPFATLGTILFVIYAIGSVAKRWAGRRVRRLQAGKGAEPGTVRLFFDGLARVLGIALRYVAILADWIQILAQGVLESFSQLFDRLEELLVQDPVRVVLSVLFAGATLYSVYVIVYSVLNYLLFPNLGAALWMGGTLLLLFTSQACAIGALYRLPFEYVAKQELQFSAKWSAIALPSYLLLFFLLTRVNRFFRVGPITKSLFILFVLLIVFMISAKARDSLTARSTDE